ncbi:zinc/iron-chelating domain-containing protein [Desulfovibrio oxyclinae]|uniref:zinc/iron-chelating domain-containing protein n=1 Tax=Desulfovibrio oxyclinae TaxID=63560 RepID=UPI00037BFAA5|nr:zinc/iron-chelating domain-containing protein [Desulfovibrio oxyclinae]
MTDTIVKDPHVCVRCAEHGPTCCRITPGQEEVCFPLSTAEWERIRDFQPDKGGFVKQANSQAFIDNVKRLFPGEDEAVAELFPERGEHVRLALRSDGSCRFLGSKGCVLPRESRPYYCRLYPFWIAGGEILVFESPTCLARRECRSLNCMMRTLKTNAATVRDLYGRLRLAWGLPPARGMRKVKRTF